MGRERRTSKQLRVSVYITLACFCLSLVQGRIRIRPGGRRINHGHVADSTGAVIPNAQVTLLNTDQGITLETKSGGDGGYTFSPVRAGHYQITVTAKGFATDNPEEHHRERCPGAAGQRFA